MKLEIASKDKERYAKENPRINVIKEKLASSDLTGTVQKLNSFLKETQFKTKFDVPEKDLSKYISLQILEGSAIS